MKNSIIKYEIYQKDIYLIELENLLNKIRIQNEIKTDILNFDINYRRMWDNTITKFKSTYYLDRGKWTDFNFISRKIYWKQCHKNKSNFNSRTIFIKIKYIIINILERYSK